MLLPLTLGGSAAPIDADHDTYPAGIDCDDGDVHAHPHAPERANGRDDDCNGRVDDEVWSGLVSTRRPERPAAEPTKVCEAPA